MPLLFWIEVLAIMEKLDACVHSTNDILFRKSVH